MFTSCQPHHPFCLGLCWEDLLFSFTFYLFPYLPFPLKMELKSPVPTRAHTHARAEASHCHTRRLTKQRHAVPRHMKEHKPLVPLLLYLLLILSLHFSLSPSQPPTPYSFFFSCCKYGEKQICVCIFFYVALFYFVLFLFFHLAIYNTFKTSIPDFFFIFTACFAL